jgi:hypothetical protein
MDNAESRELFPLERMNRKLEAEQAIDTFRAIFSLRTAAK